VLCVFCLICFTAINTLALKKLNPFWFERVAFWRGPLLEPETRYEVPAPVERQVIAANLAEQRQLALDWEQANRTAGAPRPGQFRLAPEPSVNTLLASGASATLDGGDGFSMALPAGAVRENVQATVTAAVEIPESMAGPLCGPVWNVAIGPNDHYQFNAPVALSLPYIAQDAKGGQPSLAFWNGRDWERVPSRIDPTTGKVTAEVRHASIWTVLGAFGSTTLRAAGPYALAGYIMVQGVNGSLARGGTWVKNQWGASCLRTKNFAVYYCTSGDDAVPDDVTYLGRNNRTPQAATPLMLKRFGVSDPPKDAVPLFVQDIAAYCEEGMAGIQRAGIDLPSVGITETRYNVFIGNYEALGTTKPGGHVFIRNRMDADISGANLNIEALMRATMVHELIHVAQGNYFGTTGLTIQAWRPPTDDRNAPAEPLIEGTAAYLADRICRDMGKPANMTRDYYLTPDKGRLLTRPLDRLQANDHYAWFRFMDWLDDKYGGIGTDIVLDFYKTGTLTLDALDGSLRKVFGQKRGEPGDLPRLYRAFANGFTCTGLADATLAPQIHRRTAQQQAESQTSALQYSRAANPQPRLEWMRLAVQPGSGQRDPTISLNIWDIVSLYRVNHLTSHAFYVEIPSVLQSRSPKVVIDAKVDGGSTPKALAGDWFTQALGSGTMPAGCRSVGSEAITSKGGRLTAFIPIKDPSITRATLVLHNLSLTEDISNVDVQRYLLLAPAWCDFSRDGDGDTLEARHWTVKWHRNELDSFPDVFDGYCVYRKLAGENDDHYTRIAEGLKDCVYTDHVTDLNEYAYTVRVRDKLDNLSEPAPPAPDPFVGKWAGEIQLVNGSLVLDLINGIEKSATEADAKEQARIAGLPPSEQAAATQQWQQAKKTATTIYGPSKKLALTAEDILRLGVPVEFQVRNEKGEYRLMLTEVAYKKMGMTVKHEMAMTRFGRNSLRLKADVESTDDFWLELKQHGVKSPELVLTRAPPTASQSSARNSAVPGENYVMPASPDGKFRGAEMKWWFDRTDDKPPPAVLTATEGLMVDLDKALNSGGAASK
jgi:hypothetical protein